MIRQLIRGATFQRDAYLRAVIGSNGTGDAVIIVAAVYVVLALTISPRAIVNVLGHARFILNGAFAWLILAGLIYLIARYAFNGEGSFPGMLAMSALAHPVLLLLVPAQINEVIPLSALAHPTLLALSVHRLDFLAGILVILSGLWFLGILAAGTRVAMGIALDKAVLAVGGGYLAWRLFAYVFQF